ncbi:MAG TPA: neuroendocrine convertase 1, partial [Vicinamibacteria bacterium]|nr:neuroendocrine convertase 1 [Vicinamibacteria bacterium]
MSKRTGRWTLVAAGLLAGLGMGALAPAQELTERGRQQIRAILAEKASRTPAARKLATSLVYAQRESLGQAMVQGLGPLRRVADRARVGGDGTVVVDIRAAVTDELLQTVARVGGRVTLAYPSLGAVRARVPVGELETIASLPEVRSIAPEQGFLVNTGSQTSQGDVAHGAATTRSAYGVDGTGVKVGVLSDGVDSLAARQGTGDLPPTCAPVPGPGACVTVVPGQAGSGDEGTAMLEIVHDLAPGAKLTFATAVNGDASFAQNILDLKNVHGCDVIVDDITYFNEGAFQDGVIARAVNTVKAAGALFFSSAGNSGRKDAGTSGTWEGDFLDSETTIDYFTGTDWESLPIHSWNGVAGAGSANANPLTANAPSAISLKWSDPLGAAATDYDVFLMDSGLTTVFDASIDVQATTLEPFEILGPGFAGEGLVVVRWSGPAKAL